MSRFPETLPELRALSPDRAQALCSDLREYLVETVLKTGGHLASNLGIVEISVALLRVFDPPRDAVLYDTGHQCYVHKILTGREEAFSSLRSFGGLSGFPSRGESEYDAFGTGHSGTGISAALGFARAARLAGRKDWAVAVVGDGAFTGGMIFEALNNVRPQDRLIILLNDNGMSISRSVGALKKMLSKLRTQDYYRLKGGVKNALLKIPGLGEDLARAGKKVKDQVKRSALPQGNLFEEYGLSYFGPADGNDLETVEFLLREAKKKDHPSLIHLCTIKGKGYGAAEKTPSAFHGVSPAKSASAGASFSSEFGRTLTRLAGEDEAVCAITAAMSEGVGLGEFGKTYPQRLFDVGIAEEHAMTFAAALAAAGLKPCFAVYSTFFQRCVDQWIHDVALQKLPVVLALDRAGVTGEDGATHHGVMDLALTLPCPGVTIFAPVTYRELETQLRRAFQEGGPCLLRYPKGRESEAVKEAFPCRGDIETKVFGSGEDLAIVSFGRLTEAALGAARLLSQKGLGVTVVRFAVLKGYSEEAFAAVFENAPWRGILLAEEGMAAGSFAQSLLARLAQEGRLAGKKTRIAAIPDAFVPHGSQKELLAGLGLDAEGLAREGESLAR